MAADRLRMPADLVLTPVEDLPPQVRGRFDYDEGDYAITRPQVRAPARIINRDAAELLREFSTPSTLEEAAVRYARAHGTTPLDTLEHAHPLLEWLFAGGLLVLDGDAESVCTQHGRGDHIQGWEVLEPIQLLRDSEVLQVRRRGEIAVLKIERDRDQHADIKAAFEREAALDEAVREAVAPRIVEHGEYDHRCYLVVEWYPGVNVENYAEELRVAAIDAGSSSFPEGSFLLMRASTSQGSFTATFIRATSW